MVKSLDTNSILYTLRVDNPNAIANFNQGTVVANVTKDLKQFGDSGVANVAVKISDAVRIFEGAKQDMVAKKLQKPLLRAGVSGDDLIFQITDQANSSYEKYCVLVAQYKQLKAKLAKQKATLVNMDKGDSAVDNAVKLVGAKVGKGQDKSKVDLNKKGDTAPIILIAHGADQKLSSGTVIGSAFANKSADEIVRWVAETKKLDKGYAGCLYLDGCYTAAGNDHNAFAKRVYDGLVKKGYKYMQVKGNPGLAAPTAKGTMKSAHAQVEKELQDEVRSLKTVWDNVWTTKYAATNDVDGFFKDAQITAIQGKFATATAELEETERGSGSKYIEGLVGTFGPEKLKKDSRFKKLFGLR